MASAKYFSVKHAVKILGARYIPAVCYRLDDVLEPTINGLVVKGEARVYPDKVRFVNGVPLPAVGKTPVISAYSTFPSVSPEAPKTFDTERKGRKGKRDFE